MDIGELKKLLFTATVSQTIEQQKKLLDYLPQILSEVEEEFWDDLYVSIEQCRTADGDVEGRLILFGSMLQQACTAMSERATVKIKHRREQILAEMEIDEKVTIQ